MFNKTRAFALALLLLAAPLHADGIVNGGGSGTQGNLTGDVTSVGLATTYNNVVPTAKGGVPQSAWTAGTPSPTCGTATFTAATSRSQQIAPKTTLVEFDITINAIGTCTSGSTTLSMNLPNTANSGASAASYDFTGAATVVCWIQGSGSTALNCRTPTATGSQALVAGSHFVLSAVYENQ